MVILEAVFNTQGMDNASIQALFFDKKCELAYSATNRNRLVIGSFTSTVGHSSIEILIGTPFRNRNFSEFFIKDIRELLEGLPVYGEVYSPLKEEKDRFWRNWNEISLEDSKVVYTKPL